MDHKDLPFSYGVSKEQGQAFQFSLPLCTAGKQRGPVPKARIALDVPARPAYLLLDTIANPALPSHPSSPASLKQIATCWSCPVLPVEPYLRWRPQTVHVHSTRREAQTHPALCFSQHIYFSLTVVSLSGAVGSVCVHVRGVLCLHTGAEGTGRKL